ncbi:MAG: LytTR family DNA-binding domain-containing protein [Bacteroidota bacterium]|nr:LytTR family DNA-binding domain-containing protein [Bacteroidota bacterium]
MNCIIIEDEPAAQSILEHHISRCTDLHCFGTFADAFSAQTFLDANAVDLIFLDINLPEMSGVSFLRSLVRPPLVIFTTAYSHYAVDGFDLEVVDFLLKPFSFERFYKAVNKAREKFNARSQPVLPAKLSVKSGKRIYQILVEDIQLIETCGDYVTIFCTDKKLVVHGTLKSWEEKLKASSFMKVHRTTIVNLSKIDHIEGNQIQIGVHKLPVSEQFKEQLLERIFGKNEKDPN